MADELEVDVPGVVQGGADVGHRGAGLAAAHAVSVVSVGDAQSGWVGASAGALAGMAGKWETVSARHTKAIENQAVGIDTAARLFADKEEQHAARLRAIGEQSRGVEL